MRPSMWWNSFRDKPAGASFDSMSPSARRAWLLPAIVPPFLAVRIPIFNWRSWSTTASSMCSRPVVMRASRYDERLEKDMIAVPIGPRVQRFAAAASRAYLDRCGRPEHPSELLKHACLRGRFASGVTDGLGVRARRRGGAGRAFRSAACTGRGGYGSHGRCRYRRYRHRVPV